MSTTESLEMCSTPGASPWGAQTRSDILNLTDLQRRSNFVSPGFGRSFWCEFLPLPSS
jgi:hypothetical protein